MVFAKDKKTKKMLEVESKFNEPLLSLLVNTVTEEGLSGAADIFEVSKATLGYWLMRLSIKYIRVAIGPRDVMTIKRETGETLVFKNGQMVKLGEDESS